ncbi:MAG: hypothetical protein VX764_05750 [Planctomycetota bacterium]|nr:hypothetical protein [Planctomycetota bacterium]
MRLNIGGKLRHVVKVAPSSAMLRGSVGTDLAGMLTLTKGTDIDITVVGATSGKNQVVLREIVEVTPGEQYEVHLTAPQALVPGMLRDILNIEVACGDGELRSTAVPVTIDHQAPISVIPRGNVVFQRKDTDRLKVAGTAPVKRDLQIYSTAPGTQFNITGMTVEGAPEGLFQLSQRAIRPGERYVITVQVTETRPERSVVGTLRVQTDHPEMPEVTARLYAQFGVPTPTRRPTPVPSRSSKVPAKPKLGSPEKKTQPVLKIPGQKAPRPVKPAPKPQKPVIPAPKPSESTDKS